MKTLLLPLLLASLVAHAHDLALRDGTILKDIQLREKTDLGIRVQHEGGVAFIDYSRIPAPDLFTWGFEEVKYRVAQPATAENTTYRPTRQYQSLTPAVAPSSSPSKSPAYQPSSVTTTSTARGQCAAYTKKGFRCSRMAGAGSSYCYQHP